MALKLALTLVVLAAAALPAAVQARPEKLPNGSVRLTIGAVDAEHVTITFAPDHAGPEALLIETRRVGAPGARLALSIDRGRRPLVSRILDEDDCRFDDQGSLCRIAIAGGDEAYDDLVTAFRAGKVAHIEIENAGLMVMSRDAPLAGFRRAYGAGAAESG